MDLLYVSRNNLMKVLCLTTVVTVIEMNLHRSKAASTAFLRLFIGGIYNSGPRTMVLEGQVQRGYKVVVPPIVDKKGASLSRIKLIILAKLIWWRFR